MQWFLDALSWFVNNLFWSIQVILKPVMFLAGQIIGTLIDGLLTVVLGILSTLDVGNLAVKAAGAWGGLDPRVAYMINATGVSEGLTLIGVSFLIRFTLNLIPAEFTRI